MWFLWFYLISLGICIFVMVTMGIATKNKIKREFPDLKIKKRKSFSELICAFFPFMIPFVNLVLLLVCIFQQEKVMKETIKRIKKEQE